MDRRRFVRAAAMSAAALGGLALGGCAGQSDTVAPSASEVVSGAEEPALALPAPEVDPDSPYGADANVNVRTIDEWLGRADVAYRDVRMLYDPADFAAVGGESELSRTIRGFKVVPCPHLLTLPALPVDGAYAGPSLFDVAWNDDGSVARADARYAESRRVLEELFPADRAVFLMCGAGAYAGFVKELLAFLGWDEGLLYNLGGAWYYDGDAGVDLVDRGVSDGRDVVATWRADYAFIDFSLLHAF